MGKEAVRQPGVDELLDKLNESLKSIHAGRDARKALWIKEKTFQTRFMRYWRLFNQLEEHLPGIVPSDKPVSGLIVGAGLSAPLMGAERMDMLGAMMSMYSAGPHTSRPMSWEHLELASVFERFKRNQGTGKFDWSITLVEADPSIAAVVANQRVVTVIPYMNWKTDSGAIEYARKFMPGAGRKPIEFEDYGVDQLSMIKTHFRIPDGVAEDAMAVAGIVHIPRYYRRRINVESGRIEGFPVEQGSYDIILANMASPEYIDNQHVVFGKLITGLKPGGLLITDQDITKEKLKTDAGFEEYPQVGEGDGIRSYRRT
jgi:SAM-dependent methyltransferase